MSVEKRRQYKKKSKKDEDSKGKKSSKDRHNRKQKEISPEELEARKRSQRLAVFDKKKNLFKK